MLKYKLAVSSVMSLLKDPYDNVAAVRLVDSTADTWLMRAARQRMIRGLSQEQIAHLRELTYRPFDLAAMRALPENTLGYRYATYLQRTDINQSIAVDVQPELAQAIAADWVLCRYIKTHDMMHFLLGFKINAAGEMGLQVFNFRNFREPYGLLAISGLPLSILRRGETVQTLREFVRGWSWGSRLPNLFHAPLEEMLGLDIGEARRRVGIDDTLWRTGANSPGQAAPGPRAIFNP